MGRDPSGSSDAVCASTTARRDVAFSTHYRSMAAPFRLPSGLLWSARPASSCARSMIAPALLLIWIFFLLA